MGNATHAPPNTSWGKKIPNVEFWFDLVKIITTKPRSSVTELTDFSKNRAAQARSWRIFKKIEQLSWQLTELTDFSKNRAAQSWRSWRIFPKIERLQQNVENFPFSFNLVYFSGVYFFEKLALSTVFSPKKIEQSSPKANHWGEGPPSLKPFYIKNPTQRLTIT